MKCSLFLRARRRSVDARDALPAALTDIVWTECDYSVELTYHCDLLERSERVVACNGGRRRVGRAVRALQTGEMEQLRTIGSLDRLRCNRPGCLMLLKLILLTLGEERACQWRAALETRNQHRP